MAENNIKAEIAKARKEKEVIDKLLKEKVYQLFQQEVEELFRENPDLESFTWSQYTPYFNDGDECVFSVNRENIGINGEEMEYFGDVECDVEYRANQADGNDLPALQKKMAHMKAVGMFLNNYTDDDLLDMFEDHAQVTVTRKGATTEYYNHD